MRFDKEFLAGAFAGICAGLIGAVLIFHGVIDKAHGQGTALLPFATSVTVGTTSTQIIGTNPTRKAIQICNGAGATNVAAIAPVGITPSTGATGVGVQLAIGACYVPPASIGFSGQSGAGAAWNGIGAASGQSLIVLEW
jgi:hypothetical protein